MAQDLSLDVRLRELMTAAGISSYRALAAGAGISLWQVGQLRAGKGDQMRLTVLSQIAKTLKISLGSFLQRFDLLEGGAETSSEAAGGLAQLAALQQEYARLKERVDAQEDLARSQLKTEALQTLESWLVQWPTIAARAEENETLAAVKVLPFVRPVEQLVEAWGVVAIAPVDAEVEYDPQLHQLVGGSVIAGEKVRVTHSGSWYEGKLLHRAKVKAV